MAVPTAAAAVGGGALDAQGQTLQWLLQNGLHPTLIDCVVAKVYGGDSALMQQQSAAVVEGGPDAATLAAASALTREQAHSVMATVLDTDGDHWRQADALLGHDGVRWETKFFALQLLERVIRFRWNRVEPVEREGVRNFIAGAVMSLAGEENPDQHQERMAFLQKMNQVLVQILMHEWPHNWPSFITDLVQASQEGGEGVCANNMAILSLLGEDIVIFAESGNALTVTKQKRLEDALTAELPQVFQLCANILEAYGSVSDRLILATLKCLQRFLPWAPLPFVFESQLLPGIVVHLFPQPLLRVQALLCMNEVASIRRLPDSYHQVLNELLAAFLNQVNTMVTPEFDFAGAYDGMDPADTDFVHALSLFLASLYKNHAAVLEAQPDCCRRGLAYLVALSQVPDIEVFKICLDLWHHLSHALYVAARDAHALPPGDSSASSSSAASSSGGTGVTTAEAAQEAARLRIEMYEPLLHRVRVVVIQRMARPEEVIVVEDDDGNIVREAVRDTDNIAHYKVMRETLVYLTHLNSDSTEHITLEMLTQQVEGGFTWHGLNALCWAIGSISGVMQESSEKQFLVTLIKDLLHLCEMKRGKDNKAVIASNIMYVVGQYPRFLRAHWKFLRTVVKKLFEFMHETHPGVQDMACDTFLKIATKCKRKFVTKQVNESEEFVVQLIRSIDEIVADLQPHQVLSFYATVGVMLSDRGQMVTIDRESCLLQLMAGPNRSWRDTMQQANTSVDVLFQLEVMRGLQQVLRVNTKVCGTCGPLFVAQLSAIFQDLMNLYDTYSRQISTAASTQGDAALRAQGYRAMRTAKSDILDLLTTFCENCGPPEAPYEVVANDILPRILEPVLGDYANSAPAARDPRVLALCAAATKSLRANMSPYVGRVAEGVIPFTLEMITGNFEDHPEFRVQFYNLLRELNNKCFPQTYAFNPNMLVDSVDWAVRHENHTISDVGLEILHDMLDNIQRAPEDVAQTFYQQFLMPLIQSVLGVLTDRSHKSGFKMQATILRMLFHSVQSGHVIVNLSQSTEARQRVPPAMQATLEAAGPQGIPNTQFLLEFVGNTLMDNFATLSRANVEEFLEMAFSLHVTLPQFKIHLRDFLVQIREFSAEDNTDLFLEERQQQQEQAEMQQRDYIMSVPGLANPNDLVDEDDV